MVGKEDLGRVVRAVGRLGRIFCTDCDRPFSVWQFCECVVASLRFISRCNTGLICSFGHGFTYFGYGMGIGGGAGDHEHDV